ncbi:MAG TPA: twin-arginine translocation signal domain-containing protein [Kofleriaceae bacterium]|nr:twin-arginine translocation signal domain-containing protein [Kofleriaceae bacterium]
MKKQDDETKTTWRPPTRRAFIAMIGAAGAALALREKRRRAGDPPRSPQTGKTLWIGHC